MSDATKEFRAQVGRALEELKAMRDEIKLKLHLGGMDAKEAWKKLEPRFDDLEREARQAKDEVVSSVRDTVSELQRAFEDLRSKLR